MSRKKAKSQTAEQKMAKDIEATVAKMYRFVKRNYGPRCAEFEPGCSCCKVWAAFNVFEATVWYPEYEDDLGHA